MNAALHPAQSHLARSMLASFCLLLASCTTVYSPADSATGTMDLKEARKVIALEMKKGRENTSFTMDHAARAGSAMADVRVNLTRLVITSEQGKKFVFVFSGLPAITLKEEVGMVFDKIALADVDTFYIEYPASHRVMNALYALQQNAIREKKEAAAYRAAFSASLAEHREKAAANVALPEQANKYKVQAEGAVRGKDFDDAAELYRTALNIAPWWPAGHYNRALVLSESGDFELAIDEMNYYLQLVPDAANARTAQSRIYEWERLAK